MVVGYAYWVGYAYCSFLSKLVNVLRVVAVPGLTVYQAVPTRLAALRWLLMLHRRMPEKVSPAYS